MHDKLYGKMTYAKLSTPTKCRDANLNISPIRLVHSTAPIYVLFFPVHLFVLWMGHVELGQAGEW